MANNTITVKIYKRGELIFKEYTVAAGPFGGGFANVYKIRHKTKTGQWAVKIPHFTDSAAASLIRKEVSAWKKVSGAPNIVAFYGILTQDNVPCMLSEWMDGGSLDNWITNGKLYAGGSSATLVRILDIALQVAKGLHAAHTKNVIHKDMKPANVLLSADGITAKITDFGLAAATDGTRGKSVLAATYAFASPEQIKGEVLFESTDIFSWAVSVLNMLLGTVTWQVGTAVCDNFESFFTKTLVKVPPEIIRLLRRCTHRDPVRRIKSFSEIIPVLEAWANPVKKFREDAVKKTDLASARVSRLIQDSDFRNAVHLCHDFFTRITETEKAVTYNVTRSSLSHLTKLYFCALSKCQEPTEINYKKVAKNWNKCPFLEFRKKSPAYFLSIEKELKAKKYLK